MSLPEILKEPIKELLVPPASSAGQTLKDAWELVFGGFGTYVKKKRLERFYALQSFKKSLEAKVAAIPNDKICEPRLSIIGPALESSKYYFEEPEIREMFANLIAAAMNKDTEPVVHPAFTEIIKQMSPLDAMNLSVFSNKPLPIAQYLLKELNGKIYRVLLSNVFLSNPHLTDPHKQSHSISSLEYLGLVKVDYGTWLPADSAYLAFYENDLYISYKTGSFDYPDVTVSLDKGIVSLTPLGRTFKSICLP